MMFYFIDDFNYSTAGGQAAKVYLLIKFNKRFYYFALKRCSVGESQPTRVIDIVVGKNFFLKVL